jgi:hypothetical protein
MANNEVFELSYVLTSYPYKTLNPTLQPTNSPPELTFTTISITFFTIFSIIFLVYSICLIIVSRNIFSYSEVKEIQHEELPIISIVILNLLGFTFMFECVYMDFLFSYNNDLYDIYAYIILIVRLLHIIPGIYYWLVLLNPYRSCLLLEQYHKLIDIEHMMLTVTNICIYGFTMLFVSIESCMIIFLPWVVNESNITLISTHNIRDGRSFNTGLIFPDIYLFHTSFITKLLQNGMSLLIQVLFLYEYVNNSTLKFSSLTISMIIIYLLISIIIFIYILLQVNKQNKILNGEKSILLASFDLDLELSPLKGSGISYGRNKSSYIKNSLDDSNFSLLDEKAFKNEQHNDNIKNIIQLRHELANKNIK